MTTCTTNETEVTHRLDFIHREIPAHGGRTAVAQDYYCTLPVNIQEEHIRQSLHLYGTGTVYIPFRVEGTAEEPRYIQPLNMLSLDFSEPGPGLRKPLGEDSPFLETAKQFWRDAKVIPPQTINPR